MELGKRNIKVGLAFLVMAGFFAFYLGLTIPAHLSGGIYEMDMARITLRAGHTHGMLIGICNVVIGLLLMNYNGSVKMGKGISWLGIASGLLPVGLILRGLTNGAMTFAPVAMLGGVGLLGAFILLLFGYLTVETKTVG